MYINPENMAGIIPLMPQGTNSTMFTECCEVAITNCELCCPSCGRKVVGHDAESVHERGNIRWQYATAAWKKR